jgi:hypothetical protein
MIVMMGENIRRISIVLSVILFCISLLYAQSLVEVAKKEKERRDTLKAKGITSVVVTNADLNKQKRLQMIGVSSQVPSAQGRNEARQQTTLRSSNQTVSRERLPQEAQDLDVYGYRKNATKVIFSTGPVKNPELALRPPDNKFAEISEMGVLDLDIRAKNGPGTDIAIYARMISQQDKTSNENEEGGMPLRALAVDPREGYWYGVLVMDGSEEWQEIGKGSGMSSPEEFDLGEINEIKKVRIMFKPHNNPGIGAKLDRITDEENTIGIDAIEVLH